MITKRTYFRPATNLVQEIARLAPRALRSNRTIDRALRKAYRKYDRRKQTQKPTTTLRSWVIFAIHNTRDPIRVLELVLE